MKEERVIFLDWLRVIACFMVMVTHSNEPVYLGGEGTFVASQSDALWSTLFISICRSCVPLFLLASSYLLFPVRISSGQFYLKRIKRVAIPAVIWLLIYSFFGGGDVKENLTQLVFNFCAPAGHLWFCYMIVGVYLAMPLLSPWAQNVGKKELRMILLIWAFTCLIPMIRALRIPLDGHWNLWGEANWSEFGLFYYLSGYMGYVLLGLYFKKFVPELSWRKTAAIAIPCFVIGCLASAGWFYWQMPKDFPFDRPLETAVHMEVLLRNCTVTVLMMTVALFLVLRKFNFTGRFYDRIILPVSKASYGMYLMHILLLVPLFGVFRSLFGGFGVDGGILADTVWATPAVVLCTAISTFIGSAVISCLVRRFIPLGHHIVG